MIACDAHFDFFPSRPLSVIVTAVVVLVWIGIAGTRNQVQNGRIASVFLEKGCNFQIGYFIQTLQVAGVGRAYRIIGNFLLEDGLL